jgi:uncharacterized protein DUF3572
MTPENAEILALDALAWMASEPEVMQAFLDMTGAGISDLDSHSPDPQFLGSVLEFLMNSDKNILEFAGSAGIAPESIAEARSALPGGDVVNWT